MHLAFPCEITKQIIEQIRKVPGYLLPCRFPAKKQRDLSAKCLAAKIIRCKHTLESSMEISLRNQNWKTITYLLMIWITSTKYFTNSLSKWLYLLLPLFPEKHLLFNSQGSSSTSDDISNHIPTGPSHFHPHFLFLFLLI